MTSAWAICFSIKQCTQKYLPIVKISTEKIKAVRSLIQVRIWKKIKGIWINMIHLSLNTSIILKHSLHDKWIVYPIAKCPNYITFVWKSHDINCLINGFGIVNSLGNSTFTPSILTMEKILGNQGSLLCSFGLQFKDEEHLASFTVFHTKVI